MTTNTLNEPDAIRTAVRERYGSIAREDDDTAGEGGCCGASAPATAQACCGGNVTTADYSTALGYSEEEQAAAPSGSNLGLGCGNQSRCSAFASPSRPEVAIHRRSSGCTLDGREAVDHARVSSVVNDLLAEPPQGQSDGPTIS